MLLMSSKLNFMCKIGGVPVLVKINKKLIIYIRFTPTFNDTERT